jgi:hypothetical protein
VVCREPEEIAYLALDVGGYPAPRLVALLGARPPSIQKAAQRGRADRARWDRVLIAGKTSKKQREWFRRLDREGEEFRRGGRLEAPLQGGILLVAIAA